MKIIYIFIYSNTFCDSRESNERPQSALLFTHMVFLGECKNYIVILKVLKSSWFFQKIIDFLGRVKDSWEMMCCIELINWLIGLV